MKTTFKQYIESLARSLSNNDKIKNINPDCEHHGSEGEIEDIVDLPEKGSKQVKSKHNMPGKLVKYKVTNSDNKNFEAGDTLYKDPSQLKKIK
tara:strand:+ start:2936 stop:3214 length:279 start_codon:yes stop_codon:yes gene_type:complete